MNAVIRISSRDNVATALEPLEPGCVVDAGGTRVTVRERIDAGHKVALTAIPAGEAVVKYGSTIGLATADIGAGDHVHTHNLASQRGRGDLATAPSADTRFAEPAGDVPAPPER